MMVSIPGRPSSVFVVQGKLASLLILIAFTPCYRSSHSRPHLHSFALVCIRLLLFAFLFPPFSCRSMHDKLRKIEERLAATAVVVDLPASFEEEKVKLAGMNKRYEPSTMLGLSTGTNCVMQ